MEKLQVQDDLLLACSVRMHGLDKWEMVAAEFSKAIFIFVDIKYESLKERFKNLYKMNFNEEDDDESALVKLMADILTETYINALREEFKLFDASIEIADKEEGDDTSNDKMDNIDQDFIGVLDVLRSHKYCCLFESRLSSQESDPDFVYIKQIKQHMDLQIIQNKLEQGVYSNMKFASFFRDLLLMFNNAMVYYPKDTLQYSTAFEFRAIVVRER
ncbi:hypothetical protein R3W88_000115 [Solanum pinnatisectum]|uniref:Bromo domain-containing protein n=1 Tax=Solanum pinnatisectum TaxID=50273 RepID=A0AAV9MES0_9SOLN|nr:hypothetical protein R3W88_000115 [Solanum pinnatisectum]